jgi:sphingomyelin phosphodiesterase
VRFPTFSTSVVVLVSILAYSVPVQALTRVYVQNNTMRTYKVHAVETGHPLASNHWGQTASSVLPGQRVQVIWFNRDEGITDGETFHFTTTLSLPSSSVLLKQQVQGSLINSHMWHSLAGPGINTSWHDDRTTYTATWEFGGQTIRIRYRAFFTGTDDNIEYIIQEDYARSPAGPTMLNVLAYNIYMRPIFLFKNGQLIRARLLHRILHGYDAIIFSEAFDDDARSILLKGLQNSYPYATSILGSDRGMEQDGGVIIVSKYPIEAEDQRLFGSLCKGDDCLADKGVLYARIKKQGYRYHLFASHTQADPSPEDAAIRRRQFNIIKTFIDSKQIPANEAVIIGGDLNVDKIRYFPEFQRMVCIFNAEHPQEAGYQYTFDPQTNQLAEQGTPSEYLDYILYSKVHRQPIKAFNEVRIFRSGEEWKEFPWEKALWDLSDHYAVYGHFEFAEAPHKVRVEAPPAPATKVRVEAPPAPATKVRVEAPPVSATSSKNQRNRLCRQYAEKALKQIQQRKERTGSIPPNDPVWKNDFDHHYNWCLKVPNTQSLAGTKMRDDWLSANSPSTKPKTPQGGGTWGISPVVSLESDTNRPGQDYKNFELDTPDPSLCQKACADDPDCQAYTYVKPGIQGAKARCWLKKGVPTAQSNNCCVSGVKGTAPIPPSPPSKADGSLNSFCKQYADRALKQIKQRKERTGSIPANDPVWKNDFYHHYNWCLGVSESSANKGAKLRQDWLDQHSK